MNICVFFQRRSHKFLQFPLRVDYILFKFAVVFVEVRQSVIQSVIFLVGYVVEKGLEFFSKRIDIFDFAALQN